MTFLAEVISNKILLTAFLGWLVAQILKVLIVCIKDKRLDFTRLIGSGGMPSSHSSFVTALSTAVTYECGADSPLFAVCVVLSFIVMYDASGVRRETGRQAEILNDIIENIGKDTPAVMGKRLKELIGHTPFQVFMGALLGIGIGIFMYVKF